LSARHAAIFKAVEPHFNLSDPHCIITESMLSFVDNFCLGIPKFLATLDAALQLQVRQTHLAVLQGSKKSHVRMKVPSTTTLGFATLSSLLTVGKKYSRILFGQTMYSILVMFSSVMWT
jgi:hypothetical protein